MQGFKKQARIARIVAAALVGLAFGAGSAQAYPNYLDGFGAGCGQVGCHTEFKSVGSLHVAHTSSFGINSFGMPPPITNGCNDCHNNGGGSLPVFTMGSNNSAGGGGYGCAGCHGQDYGETATTPPFVGKPKGTGYGLRLVHHNYFAANALPQLCDGCHAPNPHPVLDETSKPPYYVMHASNLRNPCDSDQEDMNFDADSVGLDNDGNGVADYPADTNCLLPTTTTSTTTTTTTTLPVTCGAAPMGVCTASEKAKLSINEKKAGKEKLKFQLTKLVPALAPADFGAPVTTDTSYALCVYNASSTLVGSYEVSRGSDNCGSDPCWSNYKTTGYAYSDKETQGADGISKIQLYGGDAGKGKIKFQGSNKFLTMPTGIAAMLSGATSATAQLVNSDGDCFGMPLPTVKKNDGLQFSASAP